jgi:hypothetical protein
VLLSVASGSAGGITASVANARPALQKAAEYQVSSCDEELTHRRFAEPDFTHKNPLFFSWGTIIYFLHQYGNFKVSPFLDKPM